MEITNTGARPGCLRQSTSPAGVACRFGGRGGQGYAVVRLLLAAFVLSTPVVEAQTQTKATAVQRASDAVQESLSPAPSATQSPHQAIPLTQVAGRAEELDRLLQEISRQLTPTPELLKSYRMAKARAEEIAERIPLAAGFLAGIPNAVELRDEDLYWRSLNQQYTAQRKLLTARASDLESQIRVLDDQWAQWQATLDQIHDPTGIEAVLDRIRHQLDAIRSTRSQAQEQLNLVLTLQNQVSQLDQQISDVLSKLVEAQERQRARLLQRDSPPLWAFGELRSSGQPVNIRIRGSIDRDVAGGEDFLQTNKLRLSGIVALYLVGLVSAFRLKRYASDARRPAGLMEASETFARPFSVALLAALLGTVGMATSSPISVAFVLCLLCLVMTLRLLPPLIEPGVRPLLYILTIFILLEGVRILIPFPPGLKRTLFSLSVLLAFVIFARLTRPFRFRQLQVPRNRLRVVVSGVRVGLLCLAAAFVASVFGFLALSEILGVATLLGALMAAALYVAARVLTLIFTTILSSDWSRTLFEKRVESIERWGSRAIALGAALLWLRSVLYLLTIHDSAMAALSNVLEYPIGYEKVSFTLAGALSLASIMLLGYALANVVTFALRKVLLPKLHLQRGLPHAISTITYYVLLVFVSLAALADAGVELNKFTVITGALGVGVGFGLQNIVNNFVSGLILLFERPININDTVEVGGVVGTVRRIGTRSSTIATFQGAEVIVPNSTLLSNQVINWTLSTPGRRVEIPVGVGYGTDPERVLKLLIDAAESNPGVMRDPRGPVAFFLGFGDSALNFELRFWAAQRETWFQLKSEVTIAVARALQQADIEIPFPQQDLHVRSIAPSVASGSVITRRDFVTETAETAHVLKEESA